MIDIDRVLAAQTVSARSKSRVAAVAFMAAVSSTLTLACDLRDSSSDKVARPANVEGTWATASSLTFGVSAWVANQGEGEGESESEGGEREGGVDAVLNLDGLTVPYEVLVDTCQTYSSMDVTINGVRLNRVHDGGWSSVPLFGSRYGCSYPVFETPCVDDQHRRSSSKCSSKALFAETGTGLGTELGTGTGTGSVEITVRIGDETRKLVVEHWLTKRTIKLVSGPLIPGRRATIQAGRRGVQLGVNEERAAGSSDGISFNYDDGRLNTKWCAIQHNEKPYVTKKYDESGGCGGSGCCTSWGIAEVDMASWIDDRFEFDVHPKLPVGPGILEYSETRIVSVNDCPFNECRLKLSRSASLATAVTTIDH